MLIAKTYPLLSAAVDAAKNFTYRLQHADPRYNGQLAKITNLVGVMGEPGYKNARIQLIDAIGTILFIPLTQLIPLSNAPPTVAPSKSSGWSVPSSRTLSS